MKFNLILAYQNLKDYIERGVGEDNWNETMIEPYWKTLTEGAPFPLDHMKPMCQMSIEEAKEQ